MFLQFYVKKFTIDNVPTGVKKILNVWILKIHLKNYIFWRFFRSYSYIKVKNEHRRKQSGLVGLIPVLK